MLSRIVFALALFAAPLASANTPLEVAQALPGAQPIGAATTRFLGFTLYDAELFTRNGDALPLSARELDAALSDMSIKAAPPRDRISGNQ